MRSFRTAKRFVSVSHSACVRIRDFQYRKNYWCATKLRDSCASYLKTGRIVSILRKIDPQSVKKLPEHEWTGFSCSDFEVGMTEKDCSFEVAFFYQWCRSFMFTEVIGLIPPSSYNSLPLCFFFSLICNGLL